MNAMTDSVDHAVDTIDNLTQARDVLNWMEALNWATCEALKSEHPSRAKHLAALGQYLAGDWANHFECQAEEFVNGQ